MSITTLGDLKDAWKELSDKLDRQNTLALHQFKQSKLAGFRSRLRPLAFGQILQLITGGLITAVSAQFWVNHLGTPHLMICGLLLQLYGLMFVVFAVRDLVLIRQIDYDAPIIAIQKQLAKVRIWHVRTAIWFAITGSLMWLPAIVVVLYLLGADPWVHSPRTVHWLVSSAVVCVAFSYGLIRLARSAGKCGRALKDSWIGRSVNRAQATLDEVKEFEREIM